MTYEVLARKWRPQLFEDVIGQGHITQTLVNAINSDRLAHAYLFSGARGVGKTSVARILAKAINCLDRQAGNPCNKCSSCTEITGGSSVDVQEIDGASNRGIDEIRELRENIKYMPSSGKYRVYIIDEVHMLTLPAFNALLKTLEEPPSHVKFLFATTEPHKVPVTILSRCQRFDFKRIPLGSIVGHLKKITENEEIEISESGLTIIAREAEGSMRDAESLLDQVASFTGAKVEDKDITDILGIIDRDIIFETSRAIIDGSPEKCIEIVGRIYNYGYDLKEFYRALMDQVRNLLVSIVAPQNELLDMTTEDREEIKRQAETAGLEKLQQSLNILITRENDLRYSSNPRLLLETIMIKLCRIGDLLSFDELIKKIEALEKRISSSPSPHVAVSSEKIAESGMVWEQEGEEVEKSSPLQDVTENNDWDTFLNFLASKSRPMFNLLKEWSFDRIEKDNLIIVRGGNSFSSSYLDEPDNLDKFTRYCRDFFKRDIKVKITGEIVKNNNYGKQEPREEGKKSEVKSKYEDLPQPVQEVLQVFQGEIKE
ncbi:DNA polymerase III subunit gamma/tau [Thermodesulfobacteriota bacterium]